MRQDKSKKNNLIFLSANHLLVDLVSVYLVIGAYFFFDIHGDSFLFLILLYGVTAFALQPLLGRLVDMSRNPYQYIFWSNLIILIALIVNTSLVPWLGIVLAGLGNALYHVAAGSIALNIEKKKAWPLGILVGPGALGLFVGGWLAREQMEMAVPLMAIMTIALVSIRYLPRITINYQSRPLKNRRLFWLTIIGLLLIVGLRALIGFGLDFEWKSQIGWAIGLVVAITLGKMSAGFIADRWGWSKMSLALVGLSLPLLIMGYDWAALGLIGAFCFQITMPVTLTAVARLQPGNPGWAFGLPCFFLIVGALTAWFAPTEWLSAQVGLLIGIQLILIFITFYFFNILSEAENV